VEEKADLPEWLHLILDAERAEEKKRACIKLFRNRKTAQKPLCMYVRVYICIYIYIYIKVK